MALSAKIADPAFEGAGQNYGTEIWRIENFEPVPLPKSDHGKFYTGDSYIVMHTSSGADTGRGAYVHDIHYWIGNKSTQDEYGTVAMKAAELDELLGGSPTLHREIQGEESDKFLSYFKPCIVPLEGGFASGFNHHEEDKFEPLLYACHEKNEITRVTQFQVARSSLNHDAVFFLITESKIFEFMGKTANVSEKIKATEVLEHLKETFHVGRTCKFVVIDDKNSVEDPDSSEFWGYFGGFASIATVEGSKDAPKAQEVAEEEKTDIL